MCGECVKVARIIGIGRMVVGAASISAVGSMDVHGKFGERVLVVIHGVVGRVRCVFVAGSWEVRQVCMEWREGCCSFGAEDMEIFWMLKVEEGGMLMEQLLCE